MSRKRREARMVDGVEFWECSKCRKWLPASGFYPRKSAPCGLASHCRLCASAWVRRKLGYTEERTWGIGLPRRGSDWVAEARQDEGPGKCVICGLLLHPRSRVLCDSQECLRTYSTISHAEARAKTRLERYRA